MTEAPKKIWLSTYMDWQDVEKQLASDDIAYIREDVVLELVEALKDAKCWRSRGVHRFSIVPKIEAALAKLEENHD